MCEYVTDEHGNKRRLWSPSAILRIMRVALGVLTLCLVSVAFKANSYIIASDELAFITFLSMAVLSGIWMWRVRCPKIVAWCSTLLFFGMFSRGIELAAWGPKNINAVAAITWILLAIWCFSLGVINQVTLSQQKAGELWGFLAQHKT